jgi:hypothetical protein
MQEMMANVQSMIEKSIRKEWLAAEKGFKKNSQERTRGWMDGAAMRLMHCSSS